MYIAYQFNKGKVLLLQKFHLILTLCHIWFQLIEF